MASSADSPRKIEWLVVIPDFKGAHEKRMGVRPAHFNGLKPAVDAGLYQMGGALLNEPAKGADPNQFSFYGSTIVISAATREEVIEIVKKDVYTKEGVWDVENAQIWPFLCAFRFEVPGQGDRFRDPNTQKE